MSEREEEPQTQRIEMVHVSKKTLQMLRQTADDIKDKGKKKEFYTNLAKAYQPAAYEERVEFERSGRYNDPQAIIDYGSALGEADTVKAARYWKTVANDNLNAEDPDYTVIEKAIDGLDKLGGKYKDDAERLREQEAAKTVGHLKGVLRKAHWGETTIRHIRPKTAGERESARGGLAEKIDTAIFVVSLLGILAFSAGTITGGVIGVARTTAAWNVVLGLVALLSGLFLVLRRK
jgi:hypothetical protein